jgi:hypothetical protein
MLHVVIGGIVVVNAMQGSLAFVGTEGGWVEMEFLFQIISGFYLRGMSTD